MALLCGLAIEIGGAGEVRLRRPVAILHRAAQGVERIGIAAGRGLFQPGARLDQVPRDALAACVEDADVELGATMTGLGGLLEKLGRLGIVARHARHARGLDQGELMHAFARARVGGMLHGSQRLLGLAAIEQHRPQPGLGLGILGRQRPQQDLRGPEVAGAIGRDRCAQLRCEVGGRVGGLSMCDGRRRQQRRQQRQPRRQQRSDHFVLKVKATAAALAFSISSGFSSCATWAMSWLALGTFQRSAMATHL